MSVRQIASLLGVSPATVSLALRNSPKIPEVTRRRVVSQAKRLGYQPDIRITELMSRVRLSRSPRPAGCFGVISLYDQQRPWEDSTHLTRIYDSMERRAAELGYRIEPLWLREPRMSLRRFRSILDARGIEGLLCFGSPELFDEFPAELDHYAIVTIGLSIRTHLHRITSHFYNDLTRALEQIHACGYRRPGLVLGRHEEHRSAHAYSSAYLGWCEHVFGSPAIMPILRMDRVEEAPLQAWLTQHRPDAIVVAHLYDAVRKFGTILERLGARVPQDLGVTAVTQILDNTQLAGIEQNQELMGAWAVELLAARVQHGDFGIPTYPRTEMVEGRWRDGPSLAARPA